MADREVIEMKSLMWLNMSKLVVWCSGPYLCPARDSLFALLCVPSGISLCVHFTWVLRLGGGN